MLTERRQTLVVCPRTCAKAGRCPRGLRQLERRAPRVGALLVEGRVAVGVVVTRCRGGYAKGCVGEVSYLPR